MGTISFSTLAATALVAIAAFPAKALNPTAAVPARSIDETAIAQAFPSASSNQPVLSVTGQGEASGVADTAEVRLVFINYSYAELFERFSPAILGVVAGGDPSGNEGFSAFLDELEPITEALLQPVVDRLVATGVPASAIEIDLDTASSGSPPFPQIDSAEISLSLNRPSLTQIEAIVAAAESAIQDDDDLFLENNFVRYTSVDCEALEQDAYEAAIANARDRANRVAAAAGVTIAGTPSIAVAGFDPYSGLESSCNVEPGDFRGQAAGATSATVELQRSLTVTYPIR